MTSILLHILLRYYLTTFLVNISDFLKNDLKRQPTKPFIAVITPNYFEENVSNVGFTFKPKHLTATSDDK